MRSRVYLLTKVTCNIITIALSLSSLVPLVSLLPPSHSTFYIAYLMSGTSYELFHFISMKLLGSRNYCSHVMDGQIRYLHKIIKLLSGRTKISISTWMTLSQSAFQCFIQHFLLGKGGNFHYLIVPPIIRASSILTSLKKAKGCRKYQGLMDTGSLFF